MHKSFYSLLLIVPFLLSCGPKVNPDNSGEEQTPPEKTDEKVVVTIGGSELSVGYEGGSGTFTVTANHDWTITSSETWVTTNPASGSSSKDAVTVNVTCEPNMASSSDRDTYLVITAGNVKEVFHVSQAGYPLVDAAPEIKNGDKVLATNPNVEKFLTEVTYPDRDWSYTKVLDYYGGFNGKTYNENGVEDPNGKMFSWGNEPQSDKPCSYSIRWNAADMESGKMTLTLTDQYNWSSETEIKAGSLYVNFTNLVPNDQYTYRVTTESGKVLAEGGFTTTGSLHQVFFKGKNTKGGCRNGRDLGGWTGLGGKTIKYRMLYRGGRMEEISASEGGPEAMAQGIGAELDLRNSDRLSKAAVPGLDFCAPGIEQGGTYMLTKGDENGNFTKQCFEFVVNSLRAGKGVYFHCSLGRDRTGTLDILLLGLLGVREGDISKAYEVTYFAPVGYSVSSSEKDSNPTPVFKNTRKQWVYSEVAPYFWGMADETEGGTFAEGVEKYLLEVAGVSQQDIDDFRNIMLE